MHLPRTFVQYVPCTFVLTSQSQPPITSDLGDLAQLPVSAISTFLRWRPHARPPERPGGACTATLDSVLARPLPITVLFQSRRRLWLSSDVSARHREIAGPATGLVCHSSLADDPLVGTHAVLSPLTELCYPYTLPWAASTCSRQPRRAHD